MTKIERQDAEINKLLDRLQEAHEERDKVKKENDELKGGIRLAISSLNDHMHPNRNGPKCWGCESLYGYAHQSYCSAIHVVELLEKRIGEVITKALE